MFQVCSPQCALYTCTDMSWVTQVLQITTTTTYILSQNINSVNELMDVSEVISLAKGT